MIPGRHSARPLGRRRSVVILTSFAVLVVLGGLGVGLARLSEPQQATSGRLTTVDCEAWNSEGFFERSSAARVADCLSAGSNAKARDPNGVPRLFWALREAEDPLVIAHLLHAGADANELVTIQGSAFTPLILAARRFPDAVPVLLDAGADPNVRGIDGTTALHVAGQWRLASTTSLLLEHGADVGATDGHGRTPLNAVAARLGRWRGDGSLHGKEVSTIKALLVGGGDAVDLAGQHWTELHTAALIGSDPQVDTLLRQGADANAELSNGWTALHLAAFANPDARAVTALLRGGADPNAQFGNGRTPLHCAAARNTSPSVIETLVEAGANPGAATSTGWTPLHAAAFANPNPDVLGALLAAGAPASASMTESWTKRDLWPDSLGATDEIATYQGDDRLSLFTLDGRGVSIHGLLTPLHVAVRFHTGTSSVSALTLGGARANARDSAGETPLHGVARADDVDLLVAAGADPNARSTDGTTPLHSAARSLNLGVAASLLDHGAVVNARAESGWTPLHHAAMPSPRNQDRRARIVGLLLRKGADPNTPDVHGVTPLHLAVRARGPDVEAVVSALTDAGADLGLQDDIGRTALHWASSRSAAPVVHVLLDAGASVAVADDTGETPWDLAQANDALKSTDAYWRLNDARF